MPSSPEVLQIPLQDMRRLKELAESSESPGIARRAKILLYKAQGKSMRDIAEELDIHYNVVYNWVKRYKERPETYDLNEFLGIAKGRGRKRTIDDDAVAWLKKQNEIRKEFGESKAEFLRRVHRDAARAGFPKLATITIQAIMARIELD